MDRKTLRALFITSVVLLAISIFLIPLYNYIDNFSSRKVEYIFVGIIASVFLTGIVMLIISLYYEREMETSPTRSVASNSINNMMA